MIRLAIKLAVLAVLVVLAVSLYHRFEPDFVHAAHMHILVPALSHLGRHLARTMRGR
jgi:hypothetical protein